MPRSDEIDISRDPGTGVDIGIGAGGMDGGFIEAVAQELDNAANNVGAGHPDWGMSGSASPIGWNNPNDIGSGDWMHQHGLLDQMETAPNVHDQMMNLLPLSIMIQLKPLKILQIEVNKDHLVNHLL